MILISSKKINCVFTKNSKFVLSPWRVLVPLQVGSAKRKSKAKALLRFVILRTKSRPWRGWNPPTGGMESTRSVVWNHLKGVYGIKPTKVSASQNAIQRQRR